MDSVRRALGLSPDDSDASVEYEPLTTATDEPTHLDDSTILAPEEDVPFSWMEYSIFTLLGVAMLWAWNMFLAAAPYFSSRFAGDPWVQANFQSAILTASTVINLTSLMVLSNFQYAANYPFRINLALVMNLVVFALLTASTAIFLDVSARGYLVFLLFMVVVSSWATGLVQNGAFAFAGSFGRSEYMQALMVGQGVAGVVPAVVQVITVLVFPPDEQPPSEADDAPKAQSSAFFYFLAAVVVSGVTIVALIPLVRRHNEIVEARMVSRMGESVTSIEEAERAARKVTSLWRLFQKLHWLCIGVALTFAETMFFPVFTSKIVSVHEGAGGLLRPAAFIPLGFFFWNLGDLNGKLASAIPLSITKKPFALFVLSVVRAGLVPLYLLCNIGGRGAVVSSDLFYLFIVQGVFGFTNGWLGSSCMMATGDWVDEGEREAASAFMGLCLVLGLAAGSVLSFTASGI
ncbi:nucleoside transporter-domain-containing protein [Stachybotrys elegans]|uniref:Nucleoside transporter-domain-containing protein n=1 Tax=Stachybotrys elegans TaxID=80388 RepID=A0A8K0T0T8_9HYPO|nr:nucleoside transporter-domain-containing protein [Stachybotrys elegans]